MKVVANYGTVMALVSTLVSDRNGLTKSSAWQHNSVAKDSSSQGQSCSWREEENFGDYILELCFAVLYRRNYSM